MRVHPERRSVRAPIALALTRRAPLQRSEVFLLLLGSTLTPFASIQKMRTSAKRNPTQSTRSISSSISGPETHVARNFSLMPYRI